MCVSVRNKYINKQTKMYLEVVNEGDMMDESLVGVADMGYVVVQQDHQMDYLHLYYRQLMA